MKDLVHMNPNIETYLTIVHGVYAKTDYVKSSFKQNKTVDTKESDLISNIFYDKNLANIEYEPFPHLPIIDEIVVGVVL